MQKETETEYKIIVDEEQFNKYFEIFVQKYGNFTTKLQVNYYYDTASNMLNENNVTVRVRQEKEKLKWQIKKHIIKQGILFSSDEYYGMLEYLPEILRIDGLQEELLLKGSLVTQRKEIDFGFSGKLCFDCNMYLGVTDYEIEIEFPEQDQENGEVIASIINSKTEMKGTTKSNRFFKQWRKINNGKGIDSRCVLDLIVCN